MFQRYTNVGFGNDTGTSNNPLNNGSELSVWEHNEQNALYVDQIDIFTPDKHIIPILHLNYV